MIVNLVLQETLAQFPVFASFEAKFQPFPWGQGVPQRKSSACSFKQGELELGQW